MAAYRLCLLLACLACGWLSALAYVRARPDAGPFVPRLVGITAFAGSMALVVVVHLAILAGRGGAYALLPLADRRAERRGSGAAPFDQTDESKVRFVCAAVRERTVARDAAAVAEAFLAIQEPGHLADFKLGLDVALRQAGSSLYELVFFLLPRGAQETVLGHVDTLLAGAAESHVQLLSDMDDTLVSTFKDRRFPFNTLYPGVQQFYHEMLRARDDPACRGWETAKQRVTFVTARPVWLSPWTQHELVRHGFESSITLMGSSTSFLTPGQMLGRKVMQCKRMKRLFPDATFYLVGDNGQRDIDLGKELLRLGLARAVFIHDIFNPLSFGLPEVAAPGPDQGPAVTLDIKPGLPLGHRLDECTEHGIVLFQSFAGAALAAVQQGLISEQALFSVATASAEDFACVPFRSEAQRQRQRDVFLRDVARVSHCLPAADARLRFLHAVHDRMAA